MESSARRIMVVTFLGQTISLGMVDCHKVRDYPNVMGQDKGSGQTQASGSNVDNP